MFDRKNSVTGDLQGEGGFDPSAVLLPPTDPNYSNNVITTPWSGVWQKTGWNTFADTYMLIEYHISTYPTTFGSPVLQYTMVQYSGRLEGWGDRMQVTAEFTHYDLKGNRTGSFSHKINGVRIPLKILPDTIQHLQIPPVP